MKIIKKGHLKILEKLFGSENIVMKRVSDLRKAACPSFYSKCPSYELEKKKTETKGKVRNSRY
jgi:hypothetical protein